MNVSIIKKIIALALCAVALFVFTGCEASDPLEENLYTSASYIRLADDGGGGYWHEHNLDGISVSPGSSGATLIQPNASTLGGWQLNAIGEYVFFDISVQEDYDGISDAQVLIYFEVNDDNSAGLVTDEVDFQLEFWCKRLGERTTTNHTYNPSVVVGQAQQHDLFVATVNCPPVPDSLVSFRLELTTITSDVDDVIINYVKLRYPTYHPALERD